MTDEPKASRREWTGLAVLALPCLLYSMDLIVLELAVPKLSADLKPTSSQLLWIMDVYGFLLAGIVECPSSSWTGRLLHWCSGIWNSGRSGRTSSTTPRGRRCTVRGCSPSWSATVTL
jgi:hypothetical protein